MREERKHQAAQELAKFKEAMKTLSVGGSDDEESSQDDSDAIDGDIEHRSSDDDFSDWEGFEGKGKTNGILKKRQQYEDDDGETTVVTIEDISEPVPDAAVDLTMSKEILEQSIHRAQEYAKMLGVGKSAKPKKKKFRYLTKSERMANNSKNNSRRSRRK
jgi:ribosomal RNA-processing protein 17